MFVMLFRGEKTSLFAELCIAAPEVVVKEKAMLASDIWGVGTLTFLL